MAIGTFRKGSLYVLAALLLAAGCDRTTPAEKSGATHATQEGITITETAAGFVFTEGSDSVMVYRPRARGPDREHARAHYVHPLYGLDGTVLTEDFPEDHLHQHGLFWAWHQVYVGARRVGDGWMQDHIEWQVREVEMLDDEPGAALRAHVDWTSPRYEEGAEPILEEVATLRAHPAHEGYRAIDVTIALRAMTDSVRIGGSEDEKGYGGFSLRVRLPDDVAFVGPMGPVTPPVTAVEAGPWVDVSATYGDSPAGVAMMQHPSIPAYPQPWILRAAGSMQNAKWPGEAPVLIPTDEPITLRYRLVVHAGQADAVSLDSLYAAYAHHTTSTRTSNR